MASAIHENSVIAAPRSFSRDETVVVERRRRRILLASKPSSPGSMSYSVVAVEDVQVVRTTTSHPRDSVERASHGQHRRDEYDTDMKKTSEGVRVMNGRARYINSFQQKHYHYLPNGPARRSRYTVPPSKQVKPPATSSFMPPTTHVIHPSPRERQRNEEEEDRQQSPEPDRAPVSPQQSQRPSPYFPSYPCSHPSRSREPERQQSPEPSSSASPPSPYFPSYSYFHPSRSRFTADKETHPQQASTSDFGPDSEPASPEMNPREGLGSREHELKELREFWNEFYDS